MYVTHDYGYAHVGHAAMGHAPSYLYAVCARDSVVHLTQTPSLHTHRELTVRLEAWMKQHNIQEEIKNRGMSSFMLENGQDTLSACTCTCTCRYMNVHMYACAYFTVYMYIYMYLQSPETVEATFTSSALISHTSTC